MLFTRSSSSAICACNAARSRSSSDGGNVSQQRQPARTDFGEAAEHDELGLLAGRIDRHHAGPQQRDQRRVAGEHAEVAFRAGNVDLIDLAGERDLLRGDEFEVERGHADPTLTSWLRRFRREPFALLDGFFDVADHVEGGFRQVVVLAVDQALEALDGVLQVDQLAGRTGEHFGDEERL